MYAGGPQPLPDEWEIPAAENPEFAGKPQIKTHLLIVDDVSDNRIILRRRFERQGFTVSEADCGWKALELIDQHEFDTVLLDIAMPDLNGIEVLAEIRKTKASTALPVIMVTARTQSEDLVEAFAMGADDYITKPVDFAVALARVKTQLARREAEKQLLIAAQKIEEANNELEQRVEQRTAQLKTINDRLHEEILHRRKSESETRYLAYHDSLTGLANRALFQQRLAESVAGLNEGEKLAILFVDLDRFKEVNDTLGHAVGDALLKEIASRIRNLIPDRDMIARLGGDEFAILQTGQNQPDAASLLASNIIDIVNQLSEIGGQEISTGASIGIALSGGRTDDPADLLRNADLAMYRAKADGRSQFRHFGPEMNEAAQVRRQMELDMRRALMHGEFSLCFQPIVNLTSGRIASLEALLRWEHPVKGMISPAEFVPIAEQTGLIVQLGEWALREACCCAAQWPAEVRVAVNLSIIQFNGGNIVATAMHALAATGLPAHRLELEITESVILEKTFRNIEILKQLRQLGVRICMDDFGTGYSSLSSLRSFRFDKIKVDQCFVRGINDHPENRAIVRAIAALGGCFGMTITAEGVETLDELKAVASEGCTDVQGNYFSRAVVPDEVCALIVRIAAESETRHRAEHCLDG